MPASTDRGPVLKINPKFITIVGFAGLLWLAFAALARADPVTVQTESAAGYDRILFEWPTAVGYQAQIDGDRLSIVFDRPFEGDLQPIQAGLGPLVSRASLSVDGRIARFDLSEPRSMQSAAGADGRVIVDLIRIAQPDAGDPPPAGGTPVRVPIRVGEHPTYGRVVFDWPRPVGYTVTRRGDDVLIDFDAPGRFDTARLAGELPTTLRGMNVDNRGAAGVRVVLQVDRGAEIRYFRSGPKIVVDVLRVPGAPPPAQDAPPAAEPPAARPAAPPAQDAAAAALSPTPLPPPVEVIDRASDAVVAAGGPDGRAPPPANESRFAAQDVGALPPGARAARPQAGETIPARFVIGEDGGILAFTWPYPVPIAVFKRGDHLWVGYDEDAAFDFSSVEITGEDLIGPPELFEDARGSVMRFLIRPDLEPTVARSGTTWTITLAPIAGPLRYSATAQMQTSSSGRERMFVSMRAVGATLEVEDPTFADRLYITPTQSTRFGVAERRSFPGFALLPTAQGIATAPTQRDIFASTFEDGVAIQSPAGLVNRGESTSEISGGTAGGNPEQQLDRLFPLDSWRRGPIGEYSENLDELRSGVAEALPAGVGAVLTTLERQALNRRRLALAQFYFAHGFGEESLAVIDEITSGEEGDAAYLNDRVFVAMRGAARILAGDDVGGAEDLSVPALDGEPEANLWRAAADVSLGRIADGAAQFFGTDPFVDAYPRHVRYFLNLLATEAAIGMRDEQQTQLYLDFMFSDDPSVRDLALVTYLSGAAAIVQGRPDEGVLVMESLLDAGSPLARTRATFDFVVTRLRLGPLSEAEEAALIADGVERLEQLQFEWRGDLFEMKVLRELGALYVRQKNYRKGLSTMRRAVQLFPATREAAETRADMERIFADLYLRDGADALPPLTALALFDDFRDLVPVGEDGDEMIRELADRLVEIDLLDRAAGLLDHQVAFRLDGIEKARVGARGAVVRLLDREPERAIEALDVSGVIDMPLDLIDQRRRLRAQAIAQLGDAEQALLLLTGDDSREGLALRAEIALGAEKWDEAAIAYEDLLGFPDPTQPLTPEDARLALNATVANTLAGNDDEVARLRDDYGQRMAETPYAAAFDVVTTQPDLSLGVVGELQEVATFQAFLGDLRTQIGEDGLSAIN